MQNLKSVTIKSSLNYSITYFDLDMYSPENENLQHTHNEYEIYINLSGAVSFVCSDNIYPVGPGNVVINRPSEPHHCVYRENISHKHYWILFTCDENEPLISIFRNREVGIGNLITLSEEQSSDLMQICAMLVSDDNKGTLTGTYHFIKLLMLLNSGNIGNKNLTPSGIRDTLAYISSNITQPISVKAMAEAANMSLSTFERHFKSYVGILPKQYIIQRRLILASEMLADGYSVNETFSTCGFSDYSHFISVFRQRFGTTPLQYQKKHRIPQK